MQLNPGTRLGPYEILSPLGAGGMGEVYRAKDTRLGRDVAIKVLPQHLSANPEVRARFEREAKTVSSLNHPNICVLHDVGREGDTDYLVMELIEGETLAARLMKGALPVADTLRIAAQIADALDRAHRAGVVHRDLKPGNIMLTKSGAKLMDFGLARATGMAGPEQGSGVTVAALTQSPTIAQPLTAEGTIVGTFQYMSPEQLEGKETDARSDLWAFGCVLYEMATGKRAFEGKSQASLIGAIMHAEPAPISQIAPMTPPELDRIVRACLVKDADDRVQSAHDLKLQLKWLADGATSTAASVAAPAMPAPAAKRRSWLLPAGITAIVAVGATALVMSMMARGGAPEPVAGQTERFILGSAALELSSTPVLSPDGRTVLFAAQDGSTQRIYRRDLASFDMSPISGTDGGTTPCFSPDGAWIAFTTASDIKKVPAAGGVAQTVLSNTRINSITWGEDGMIYFTPVGGGDDASALSRIPAAGGRPEVVARLDTAAVEADAWLPSMLPHGKGILLTIHGNTWHTDVLKPDGSRKTLIDNSLCSAYVEPGYLVYGDLTSGAALVAPFDLDRLEVTGAAVPLTEPLNLNLCFGVDGTRTLVYVPASGAGQLRDVVWLSRDGSSTPVFDGPADWVQPRMSPDGKRILLRKVAADCELWIYDIERASLARLVPTGDNHDPIWSGDGRFVAYSRSDLGMKMMMVAADGVPTITEIPATGSPRAWSRIGNVLVYEATGRKTGNDIWTLVMDGRSEPQPFVDTPFDERHPSISPDGKWIAYVSDESGTAEVFVRAYPPTGETWRVSTGGAESPLWSRNGRELYFAQGTRMMMLSVETQPTFKMGKLQELFNGGFDISRAHNLDVTPDGTFVAVRSQGGAAGMYEMRVLRNWTAEIQRVSAPVAH